MTIPELINRKDNKVYLVKLAMGLGELVNLEDVVITTPLKELMSEMTHVPHKVTPDLPELSNPSITRAVAMYIKIGRIDEAISTLETYRMGLIPPVGFGLPPTEEDRVAISEFLEGMKGVETGTTITSLEYGLLAHFEQDTIIIEEHPLVLFSQIHGLGKMTRDKQLIILDSWGPWDAYEEVFGDRLEVYEKLEYTVP